jgi:hypothetical protein
MGMIRVRVLNKQQARNIKGKTDLEKLEKMTDVEVHNAALSDPDAPSLTDYQRTQFKPFMFLKRKLVR